MTSLVANHLSLKAADKLIVNDVSLTLQPGELVAVLGANGAGKTSLLRSLLGLTTLSGGAATLDNADCAGLSPAQRAKLVSYLPQQRPLAWPYKVRDVISLGRFAYGAAVGRLSDVDAAAVDEAIEACDLAALQHRSTDRLSGGELARVHFARTIAAKAPLLVADEPVAELDPRHQIQVASLIRKFVDDGGGALVVLHEVALAAQIADRLIWLKDGRIVVEGTPKDTVTAQTMETVYGVRAHVDRDEHGFDIRMKITP